MIMPSQPKTHIEGDRQLSTPMYKLPAELVRKILLFLKECNVPSHPSKSSIFGLEYNPFQHRWIIDISHVSRFFRNISLEYPDLWTNIPLRPHELTAIFLERSGQVSRLTRVIEDKDPISKNLNLWTAAHRLRVKQLMNKYLPRIRVLQICLPPSPSPLLDIFTGLNASPSSLHELHLIHSDGYYPINTTLSELFRSDFIFSASNLQVLQLEGFGTTDISILPFARLRSLSVNFGKTFVEVDLPSLLNLLARNPRLEELVLLGLMHSSSAPIQPPVCLLNLRRLDLKGELRALSIFIRTLVVSEPVTISLYTTVQSHTHFSTTALEIQRAIQCTAFLISRGATMNIHQFSINHQYSWKSELLFSLRPEICYASHCPVRCHHGLTTIHLELLNADISAIRTLVDCCQSSPIPDINNISLHGGPLSEFVGTASKTMDTFLIVGNPSLENLRWFLPFALITDDKYRRRFPSIHVISIKDSGFEGQDRRGTQAFVGVLVDLLVMCQPCSVHLEKIEINNCKNVTSGMVAKLQEFVETVTWDGRS